MTRKGPSQVSDPAAATIPPAALRVLRLPTEPEVATPPPPPGLEPPIELEPDAETDPGHEPEPEPGPRLGMPYDPELKFAALPLLHLSPEERADVRLRRMVQLLEQIANDTSVARGQQGTQLKLLEGWQTAVTDGATALVYVGQQNCMSLVRMVISHPKFPHAFATAGATLVGGSSFGAAFWRFVVPWLWP